MTPERWETIKQVFDTALELQPESRDAYLRDACTGDPELYAEADRLLREFESAGGFLDENLFQTNSTLSAGDLIAGRYRIERLLGRGGMGEVYEARDELLGETVALKTLRAGLAGNPSILRRFQSEIQLARKVTHPNVCRIYEVGVDEGVGGGLHFFVMEYLRGETLAARIGREGKLSKAEAFPIAAQIAEGLAAAHKAGIVHRDLKSANVMLVPDSTGERAVITDFGLARLEIGGTAGGPATNPESELAIAGTVGYMSPEQFTGGTITAASDIYSFGIVLFEMASGRLPFDDQHLIRAAVQRANRDTAPVRTLAPDVDERWKTAIARCLERDPGKRPQSAEKLADLFREDGWRMPGRHWGAKQWVRAAAVAAVAVAGAAGLWGWTHRPYKPPAAAQAWYDKGVAAMHAMTFEAARKALEQAVAADPRFALAHAALAETYAELDYTERANAEMLKAQTAAEETILSSKDTERFRALRFMVSREFDRAAEIYKGLEKEAAGAEKAGAAFDTGIVAEKKEDIVGAIAAFDRVERLDPQDPAAKLHLGAMLARQRKVDAALAKYSEAEVLYNAESDYEGLTEIYFVRATLLNRSGRAAETIAEIEKALRITETTGNKYQQIRLQLLEGVAYRNLGDTDKAASLAKEAVQTAIDNGMEGTAAVGVIDLGNAFSLRGEPKPAEEYFQQGLNLAKRSKARQSEARAELSLGSLLAQYDRPAEARPLVEAASEFYRKGGYRRETIQALLLLGKTQQGLAEFAEGEKTLRETVEASGQLHDNGVAGAVHEELGLILEAEGALPEALKEFETAAGLQKNGLGFASDRLDSAGIFWRLNRDSDAERAFQDVDAFLNKGKGENQLHARLLGFLSEETYAARNYSATLRLASEAATIEPGEDDAEGRDALLMQGLAKIRLGRVAEGLQQCDHTLQVYERGQDAYGLARARLLLAKALQTVGQKPKALELARLAMNFFEPRHIAEQMWQADWVLAETSGQAQSNYRERARSELSELTKSWPRSDFEGYLKAAERSGISMTWFQPELRVKQ